MLQYIVRRIFLSIPVLLGILLVTFAIARLIPGDPCRAILGEKATQAVCDRFIREKGLDKPIYTQFGIYIGEILRGDFGQSVRYGMPVTRMLAERLPMTLELSVAALLISMVVGILSALFRLSNIIPGWMCSPWCGQIWAYRCRSSGWD